MQEPFFSVIIPAFNRAHVLAPTLNSVLSQNFADWELILIDDGSTDKTQEVIAGHLSDTRIRYFFQENKGVSSARNLGASKAGGLFLVFLDSDDQVEINWLANFDHLLHNEKDMAFCAAKFIYYNGATLIKRPKNLGYLYRNLVGILNAGTYAVSRKLFLQAGGFDVNLSFGENYDLGVRLAALNPSTSCNDEPLLIYNKEAKRDPAGLTRRIQSKRWLLKKYNELQLFTAEDYARFKLETLQSLGVDLLQSGEAGSGRQALVEVLKMKPLSVKTMARLLLSFTNYYGATKSYS